MKEILGDIIMKRVNDMTDEEIEADNKRIDDIIKSRKEKKRKQYEKTYTASKEKKKKYRPHTFMRISYYSKCKGINISPFDLWKMAKKQECKCPYSGRKLENGNIHLDHIIPKSKGGSNNISNLQLLPGEINTMKWNILPDEFVKICKEITKHYEPILTQTRFPFSYL
jgi:5-methylcytosine-specific restriction endonuclease McrA